MENLSLRAAARELGISHVGLLRAVQSGRVTRQSDGTFNVDSVRVELDLNTDPRRSAQSRKQRVTAKSA